MASRAEPEQPVLLAGPRSAAVLSGAGEFHWLRECRGERTECAEVTAVGLRLVSRWTVRFGTGTPLTPLESSLRALTVRRGVLESRHEADGVRLEQRVYPVGEPPGVAREFRLQAEERSPAHARLECSLRPFLAPILLEGVKPYEYAFALSARGLRVESSGFGLRLESEPEAARWFRDGAAWDGRPASGELGEMGARWALEIPAGGSASVRMCLWGGAERAVRLGSGPARVPIPWDAGAASEAYYAQWLASTPELALPDAPALEAGYRLARSALRALYYAPERGCTGVRAGVPWYAALWCRDLAWALPAILWMGDLAWAEESLRCVYGYQAPARIPLLGAEAGELPMQVAPGPVFLFGTSDTSLYYPALLARQVAHSGSTQLLADLGDALELTRQYLLGRQDPRTGLFRHGGEVAALEEATEGLSRVRFGIDATDTTIWDSADRRDSAIDIQVLGVAAWRALAELEAHAGRRSEASDARARAGALAARLEPTYGWSEESYLADSIRGGVPVRQLRPNALLAVSAGLLRPELARRMVHRAAQPDLSTPWGVRTLSSRDAEYDPLAYHGGQVWPLATGWAAEAAFAAGEEELALGYLERLAQTLIEERGYANECYRGDRSEPWNSCFLLGFSVAPFLTVLFERLWGVRPRLGEGRVELAPQLPRRWEHGALRGIRLGGGRLDLEFDARRYRASYAGTAPLTLVGPGGERSATGPSVSLELLRSR
ncbi:MAG: hypothetical protein L3K04_00750 [Thermoplasmata archaeon]|nr:hypothetical protein [Thermoplasmata archaeon]MCI4337767.1 hypothetical protein [Thermoplasmata archaeon]MCI4340855.1 hypothetical protein [Thermoplasmata archaeon]